METCEWRYSWDKLECEGLAISETLVTCCEWGKWTLARCSETNEVDESELSRVRAVIERPLGEVTETWHFIRRVLGFRTVTVFEDTGVKGLSGVRDTVDEVRVNVKKGVMGFLALLTFVEWFVLLDKVSWSEAVGTQVVCLYCRHLAIMRNSLTLGTRKELVWVSLTKRTRFTCWLRGASSVTGDSLAVSLT